MSSRRAGCWGAASAVALVLLFGLDPIRVPSVEAETRVAQIPNELAQSETRERRKRSRDRKARDRKPAAEQNDAKSPAKEPTSDATDEEASDAEGRASKDAKSGKAKPSSLEEAKPKASDAKTGEQKSGPAARTPAALPIPLPAAPTEPLPKPDVWTDQEIIGALQACLKEVGPAVAEIEAAAPVRNGQCGAPAPVVVRRIGPAPGVEVRPPALVNCAMVGRLHEWVERVVQPAARDIFGAPVAAITNLSGYDCRFRNNAPEGKLSEHGYANALDVTGFVMANKRAVEVLANWGPTARDLAARPALAPASARTKERQASRPPRLTDAEIRELEAAAEPSADDSSARARKKSRRQIARAREALTRQAEAGKLDGDLEGGGRRKRDRDRAAKTKTDDVARSEAKGAETREAPVPAPEAATASERPRAMTPERTFLTRVHDGACGIFTTVLGPEANEAHRNHFHLDLAPRKRKAFCE